jgi:hypothetical protein
VGGRWLGREGRQAGRADPPPLKDVVGAVRAGRSWWSSNVTRGLWVAVEVPSSYLSQIDPAAPTTHAKPDTVWRVGPHRLIPIRRQH